MPISTPPTESVTASLSEAGYKYLTAATAVLVLYPTIFPRAAAAIFLIPVMLAFGLLWARKDRSKLSLRVGPLLWSAVAFAVFAIVSAAWSAAPLASLSKPLFLLGGSIGIGVLAMLAREYDARGITI